MLWVLSLALMVVSAIAIDVSDGCHEGGWLQQDCLLYDVDITASVNVAIVISITGFFLLPIGYLLFRLIGPLLFRMRNRSN